MFSLPAADVLVNNEHHHQSATDAADSVTGVTSRYSTRYIVIVSSLAAVALAIVIVITCTVVVSRIISM